MDSWSDKLFKERADLIVRLMNLRWSNTDRYVQSMLDTLKQYGIESGNMLDLCCGNGRVSINFALKGFKSTGVDYSPFLIEDAKKKAVANKVTDKVDFILGDVRNLDALLGDRTFNVVVNAWTSIGYTTPEDDASIFRQAKTHAEENSVLFIIDTMHQGRASMNPHPTSYIDFDDMMMLESSEYDQLSSRIDTTWRFYWKKGEDLVYEDECRYNIYVYSLSELSNLLRESGWRVESYYGGMVTRQPMTPLTGMNIVARPIT